MNVAAGVILLATTVVFARHVWREHRRWRRYLTRLEARRARGAEDFYWARYGQQEAIHAAAIHLRRQMLAVAEVAPGVFMPGWSVRAPDTGTVPARLRAVEPRDAA